MKRILVVFCTALLFIEMNAQALVEADIAINVGKIPFFANPITGTIQKGEAGFQAFDGEVWRSLQTHTYGVIYDIEGNAYRTVQIGGQTWMADNLKVTRFNDSTILESGLTKELFQSAGVLKTGSWAYLDYNKEHLESFGRLYNGYVIRADKNICPEGWMVPSIDDFNVLLSYIGSTNTSSSNSAGVLRTTGIRSEQTGFWEYPNYNATNSLHFNLEPSGYISDQGAMFNQYIGAYMWTGDIHETAGFDIRVTNESDGFIYQGSIPKSSGRTIRCFKD